MAVVGGAVVAAWGAVGTAATAAGITWGGVAAAASLAASAYGAYKTSHAPAGSTQAQLMAPGSEGSRQLMAKQITDRDATNAKKDKLKKGKKKQFKIDRKEPKAQISSTSGVSTDATIKSAGVQI